METTENTKLYEHAEMWWEKQGNTVPYKGTKAYKKMYNRWIAFAFTDMMDKDTDFYECHRCAYGFDVNKKQVGNTKCPKCGNDTDFIKLS